MEYFKKNKELLFNIVIAFFTYLAFLIYFGFILEKESFNFILSILFIGLIYFYNKENVKYISYDKRDRWIVGIFSFILSFMLIVGSIVYPHINNSDIIFGKRNILYSIIGIIGFYFFFRIVIMKIFNYNYKIIDDKKKKNFTKKQFILTMLVFILCWLPYLIRCFPAIMTPDSYYVVHHVKYGILNDHHTFGHTWFFGFFYLISNHLFKSTLLSIAFYSIVQIILCSFILSYVIKFLYERNVKKIYLYFIILFMAISPLHARYSITLWRDILFSYSFILIFIIYYQYVEDNYKFSKKNIFLYIVSLIILLFFRNNGIYVLIFLTPILLLFSKKNRKLLATFHILVIVLYFVIKGPIFDYFNVYKSISSEAYSIPLQQIARVVSLDKKIDKKDYKYLSSIINVEEMGKKYTPYISDDVKRMVDSKKLSKTKTKFFRVWFHNLFKYPNIYFEAYFSQTLGYWYPDVIISPTGGAHAKSFLDKDVYNSPKFEKILKILDYNTSKELPLVNFIWSLGFVFICYVMAIFYLIYKKQYKYILPYMPLLCLWISLMLASPVYAELRYFYGMFLCLPLILFVPVLKKKH